MRRKLPARSSSFARPGRCRPSGPTIWSRNPSSISREASAVCRNISAPCQSGPRDPRSGRCVPREGVLEGQAERPVGTYFGLAGRKFQSCETDLTGRISKCGDREVRAALYEVANVILSRPSKSTALKDWGMNLLSLAGPKKTKSPSAQTRRDFTSHVDGWRRIRQRQRRSPHHPHRRTIARRPGGPTPSSPRSKSLRRDAWNRSSREWASSDNTQLRESRLAGRSSQNLIKQQSSTDCGPKHEAGGVTTIRD
ncbi:MAG: transposase [Hyphomonadaceae bacterium]|nr:transposase [Hyphomonadaceae bacterium]